PAQIGRRLIATAQAARGDLYLVRVHPADYARLAPDRDLLEGRWSAMLREALPGHPHVRVVLDEDADVVAGSLAIAPVLDDRPVALLLERSDGTRVAIGDGVTIGRESDNGVVVRDARVSRHHARILADDDGWAVEDADSSNGTYLDGARVRRARLARGQTLTVGDTSFKVVEG
ncbi:MAG TPA: FHA domain-containing protein, partial [Candidatus Acidoferrum sp.]|nr:FHA domain-containing protein [Candidatus Acidoferrum sp.]